ncbi:cation transport protein-domain-containing protein [Clohesyomyces aquaticus]|uniref:Potassium transport protein n=1 Tax=Clohesyomyces aquaticus TaxID=1231657 RepID=A0A1Y2AAF4_9PLEO|nr:cation transport protein-domain-containing protein [Clohesyomyces aquaticus]
MFGPWLVMFAWFREHMPSSLKALKPGFNFITIHYMYLVGMALLGSILLYPAGGMAYVDALFFASGAATQSGLNTIDINTLFLYQQVVIMLIACMCNPIFINTFVVFVRLYWFEKRFQNVAQEARSMRRTRTRSRTKSEAKADMDRDMGREEAGVGNREIRVLRGANGQAKGEKIDDEALFEKSKAQETEKGEGSSSSPATSPTDRDTEQTFESEPSLRDQQTVEKEQPLEKEQTNTPFHRDIMFADEVSPTSQQGNPESERIPDKRAKEHHIAFVENQRNPKDKGALRIPGPRDFDRGFVPHRIEDDDLESLNQEMSNDAEGQIRRKRSRSISMPPTELNHDDHPLKRNITIDEPDHGPRRAGALPSAFARFGSRAKTSDSEAPSGGMFLRNRARSKTLTSLLSRDKEDHDPMPYLSWTPTVGRNSAFVDLTEEQREELGGIEYRSLKLLAVILVCYFVGFHLLGMVCLLPWIVRSIKYTNVVREVGIGPVWWGFFTPASMFNDLGFTLTPDSMISFQFAPLPLILGIFLIIIGNTGFPCMLRFIIWLCEKCVPRGSGVWEELRFLLDHPRRCFTLLFPSQANWWLFWVLILLNGIDLIFFVILDLNDPTVTVLPPGFRFLDGLFQAASTRTAGFSVVNLADLHPAIQVSYLIMMYISVFPIAISMRQTNVYEERSLGVWSDNDDEAPSNYLGQHLRRQLSFDLWFVFLGFFLIAIIEGHRLENTNDYAFTLFSVLFEIVSAYGTVGLSLGYPGVNTSFSGQFRTLSKLIIIAMQIRGRHRGLPYALDRAILLPSESLHRKEDEDAMRRARRGSHTSGAEGESQGLMRPRTAGSRRGSTATGTNGQLAEGVGERGRSQTHTYSHPGNNLTRFLSGALSAGPTIQREKRA